MPSSFTWSRKHHATSRLTLELLSVREDDDLCRRLELERAIILISLPVFRRERWEIEYLERRYHLEAEPLDSV
jgi:hypothetical protein